MWRRRAHRSPKLIVVGSDAWLAATPGAPTWSSCVDDNVTTHEGWGLGSYCNFTADPTIVQDHGFEAPTTAGVKFHDLLVVSLGGMGQYAHVIDNTGPGTSGTSTVPSTVTSYP
jgi:hypothetical protein